MGAFGGVQRRPSVGSLRCGQGRMMRMMMVMMMMFSFAVRGGHRLTSRLNPSQLS